ncbi:MAG TPA: DUF4197 domain-containing protein [Crocinitomix sp.]|nr:DUF4197 domain-containing protein [Crocinitomix sp.]
MSMMFFTQCDILEQVASDVVSGDSSSGGTTKPALTNEEVIAGLKEALTIGIKNGANMASMTDGFFKRPEIKLPFPPSAIAIKDYCDEKGIFQNQLKKIDTTLNRAAEEASKKATPIFVDAIKNMSIADGFTILRGSDSAATMYLQEHTTGKLVEAFRPVVHNAIQKVKLTEYWNPVAEKYNFVQRLRNKPEVTTDLDGYVTERGINGLFFLVKQEEKKIRKDPVAQVTDLLKKVFGSLLGGN